MRVVKRIGAAIVHSLSIKVLNMEIFTKKLALVFLIQVAKRFYLGKIRLCKGYKSPILIVACKGIRHLGVNAPRMARNYNCFHDKLFLIYK